MAVLRAFNMMLVSTNNHSVTVAAAAASYWAGTGDSNCIKSWRMTKQFLLIEASSAHQCHYNS
eukprot:scaffold455505_cov13-Prasinocladus_malaysianus.AAC.1